MRSWPVLMVIAMALAACGGRGDREVQRRRWALERQALSSTFDQLEERLVTDAARVRFWREMRDRHESATALACSSLERHAEGMALFREHEREKREALARKNRVAQLHTDDGTAVH